MQVSRTQQHKPRMRIDQICVCVCTVCSCLVCLLLGERQSCGTQCLSLLLSHCIFMYNRTYMHMLPSAEADSRIAFPHPHLSHFFSLALFLMNFIQMFIHCCSKYIFHPDKTKSHEKFTCCFSVMCYSSECLSLTCDRCRRRTNATR